MRRVVVRTLLVLAVVACGTVAASAHDPQNRKLPPSKATAELKAARADMDAAKRKLADEGLYSCCMKPSCDLCARTNGSCICAANLAAGLGTCGECLEGWKAGRGTVKGVKKDAVTLLPSDKQASRGGGTPPPELKSAREHMNAAKRILVSEGRFSCCVGDGGCDACAHEKFCPCGTELAESLATPAGDAKTAKAAAPKGVCGECFDGWHRGHGAFAGVDAAEVHLDTSGHGAMMMPSLAGGPYRTMSAIGSGTSLIPASSPMYMLSKTAGDWVLSLHGDLRVGFNDQGGPRGVGKLESQNWVMGMADHPLGPGLLSLRAMLSAEPITTPHGGFPELFQTGESYRGREIVDAQHPHDLFMELAASYTIALSDSVALQFYGGPVGEPALGPPAFMHRPSAAENPAAPLGHHWMDSTHIADGVVTTGLQVGKFKFEGSAFHGAEPDENRATIDLGALDSWSVRVNFAPTRDWSMQVSHGRLNNPEATEPGDTVRTTASVMYNRRIDRGNWATSVIWGRNHRDDGDSNAYLLESTLRFLDRNTVYTRLELGDKRHLLDENIFDRPGLPNAASYGDPWFRVGAYSFGYVRDVYVNEWVNIGVGADVTTYSKPYELDAVYGQTPTSYHVYVRIRPSGRHM